jgi:hypothetical protein
MYIRVGRGVLWQTDLLYVSDQRCPICNVLAKRLQNHLKKVHLGAFSPWRQNATRNQPLQASELISCSVCRSPLKKKNLASHLRRVHHADSPGTQDRWVKAPFGAAKNYRFKRKKSRSTLHAANIRTSLSRIPMIKVAHRPRKNSKSQSVWTVSGGLPETNRGRH